MVKGFVQKKLGSLPIKAPPRCLYETPWRPGHLQLASRGGYLTKDTNTAGRGGLAPPRVGSTCWAGGSDPPKVWYDMLGGGV